MKNLVSMKLDKKAKKDKEATCCAEPADKPEFPWGLRITLEKEQIKKLGGLECDVSDTVGVQAVGNIVSVRKEKIQSDNGESSRHTIEIQLTDIDVVTDGDFEKAFDKASKED